MVKQFFFSKLNVKNHSIHDSIVMYCFVYEGYVDTLKYKTNLESVISRFNTKFIKWYELGVTPKESITILWSKFFFTFYNEEDGKTLLNYINKISHNHLDRFTFIKKLNEIDSNFCKIIGEDIILELENQLNDWNGDYPMLIEKCFDLSGFYSGINNSKAISYFKKAISNSFLRHGWRKDNIISFYLNSSFELITENHWKTKKEIIKISKSLFNLNLRLYQITDLKETRYGVSYIIQIIANYDTKCARKYLKIFRKEYYDRSDIINKCLRDILKQEIKNDFITIDEINKEINYFSKQRDYEQNIISSYYENIFIVYMEVLNSYFYSYENKKIAFELAYKYLEQAQKVKNYQIGYIIDNEIISKFNDYCGKFKKEIILNLKNETVNDNDQNTIISEKDFVDQINESNSKKEIVALYEKFKDSSNIKIEIKSIATWKLLIDKTYEIESNISLFIDLLKSLHYLDWGGNYTENSNYLHIGVNYVFSKSLYKNEILEFYSKESGHSGFYNSILIYEKVRNKDMTNKLFDRFHKFCDFLVN